MSDEPTERDVEALAEVIGGAYYDDPEFTLPDAADGPHFLNAARAVAERIAQARREGAAEVVARVEAVADKWEAIGFHTAPIRDLRAALRGDA